MQLTYIDKQAFMSHLYIEMKSHRYNKWLALNEENGRMPDADIYEKIFNDYVNDKLIKELGFVISSKPLVFYHKIDLTHGDGKLIKNPFVRNIFIRFEICYGKKNFHYSMHDEDNTHFDDRTNMKDIDPDLELSDFAADYYHITKDEHKLPCTCITLSCTCQNNAQLKKYLYMDFAHELMHAYDEYCRNVHGAKSFKDTKFYQRYKEVVKGGNYDQIEYDARNFIYETTKTEQNAVNAQLKNEMEGLMLEYPEEGDDHVNYIWSVVKKTEVWAKMTHAIKVENDVLNAEKPEDRLDYINVFGSLLRKKFRYYNDLIRYVTKQAEALRKHVIHNSYAIANEFLVKYTMPPFEGCVNFGSDYLDEFDDSRYFGLAKIKR